MNDLISHITVSYYSTTDISYGVWQRNTIANVVGCICKGKGLIKQPVTETKIKFYRLLFAVQENQQDKLLAIKQKFDRLLFAVQENQKDKLLAIKQKFDRLLFAVQGNQQDKLLAIKHAAIDRAQNFTNSLDI